MAEIVDEQTQVAEVRELHRQLLDAWNVREPRDFAALFAADGTLVGFDGSTVEGDGEIRTHLESIFDGHPTGTYVAAIRDVRFLYPGVAVLRAEAGMTPPGDTELDPAFNAVQVLIAVRYGAPWRIAHFQNTPAAWDERPEAVAALTKELGDLAHDAP